MTPVLEVEDLTVDFGVEGRRIAALRGVTFSVNAGERVGIVGESGSGKSVTAQAIMRLLPKTAQINGTVKFAGDDVFSFNQHRLAAWRGAEIAMIFQDPMSSLNPLMRIGSQITETLRRHRGLSKAAAKSAATDLLESVGIADAHRRLKDFPHAFSGGMRQRVCIAIAISCTPGVDHRGRADDRAGRDHPGAGPGPARRAGRRPRQRRGADQPRSRCGVELLRSHRHHVCRRHRGIRPCRSHCRRATASVHQGVARLDPPDGR